MRRQRLRWPCCGSTSARSSASIRKHSQASASMGSQAVLVAAGKQIAVVIVTCILGALEDPTYNLSSYSRLRVNMEVCDGMFCAPTSPARSHKDGFL